MPKALGGFSGGETLVEYTFRACFVIIVSSLFLFGVLRGPREGPSGGFTGGDPPGGIPRGPPEVLGRFWNDSGSILGRFWPTLVARFWVDFGLILGRF